jgi:hypothetical protein
MMETISLVEEGDVVVEETSHVIEDPKPENGPAILFHVYMVLLSLFLGMMVTNWGAVGELSDRESWTNMCIQLTA